MTASQHKHQLVVGRNQKDMQEEPGEVHMNVRCACFHKRISHGMGGTGRFHSSTRACFFLNCKCISFKEKGVME